ncbi:hypothetical protein O3W44_04365 [Pantoea sp. LMR881]|nr:hypothetical protein [Pantoea sp. LMR881]
MFNTRKTGTYENEMASERNMTRREPLFRGTPLPTSELNAALLSATILACVNRNIVVIGEVTAAFFAPFFHLVPCLCRMFCKIIFSTAMFRHKSPLHKYQKDKYQ